MDKFTVTLTYKPLTKITITQVFQVLLYLHYKHNITIWNIVAIISIAVLALNVSVEESLFSVIRQLNSDLIVGKLLTN